MEREAGIAPPARTIREAPRRPRFTSGSVLRLLVFVALAAFLLYYVGPRNIAETSLKVALAVALTVAVWVGANLLFDQAYDHWTRFNTIIGAVLGFVGYFVAGVERLAQDARRSTGAAHRLRRCSTPSPDGARGRSTSTGCCGG